MTSRSEAYPLEQANQREQRGANSLTGTAPAGLYLARKRERPAGRPLLFLRHLRESCRHGPGTPGPMPPFSPLCRCGATLPPVATPRL